MDVTILGCRGSYPVADPKIIRYGGDTTCLQVMGKDTALILDAGTGCRNLAPIPDHIHDAHLFITHLHWDHIMGFPFMPILTTRPDLTLHIYSIERSHDRFYSALSQSVSTPLTAHSLDNMVVNFKFHELAPGAEVTVNNEFQVSCALANHPYQAFGYRVENSNKSFAFIPDTAPFDRYLFDTQIVFKETSLTAPEREILVQRQDAIIKLAGDVDWLIYDAALTPEEYERLPHWGHSTMPQAVEMAKAAASKSLIFFHHNPGRTDDELDAMLAHQKTLHPNLNLLSAYAGMTLS